MRKALYILGEFTDADLNFLSQAGSILTLENGDHLISAGSAIDALYIVASGALEVLLPDGESLAQLDAGDAVGEISFVQSQAPETNVVAIESSRVLAIPKDVLVAELEANSAFAARFYKALATFLSDRLRAMTSQEDELEILHVADERMTRIVSMLGEK